MNWKGLALLGGAALVGFTIFRARGRSITELPQRQSYRSLIDYQARLGSRGRNIAIRPSRNPFQAYYNEVDV